MNRLMLVAVLAAGCTSDDGATAPDANDGLVTCDPTWDVLYPRLDAPRCEPACFAPPAQLGTATCNVVRVVDGQQVKSTCAHFFGTVMGNNPSAGCCLPSDDEVLAFAACVP